MTITVYHYRYPIGDDDGPFLVGAHSFSQWQHASIFLRERDFYFFLLSEDQIRFKRAKFANDFAIIEIEEIDQ